MEEGRRTGTEVSRLRVGLIAYFNLGLLGWGAPLGRGAHEIPCGFLYRYQLAGALTAGACMHMHDFYLNKTPSIPVNGRKLGASDGM